MKKIVLMAIVSLSFSSVHAQDAITWTSDTLTSVIQERVEEAVGAHCEYYGNGLKESRIEVRQERIDQGVIDTFYTIILSTSQRVDQMIFEDVDAIQVEVAEYSFSNPLAGDPIEIVSLVGLSAGRCSR